MKQLNAMGTRRHYYRSAAAAAARMPPQQQGPNSTQQQGPQTPQSQQSNLNGMPGGVVSHLNRSNPMQQPNGPPPSSSTNPNAMMATRTSFDINDPNGSNNDMIASMGLVLNNNPGSIGMNNSNNYMHPGKVPYNMYLF